MANVKWTPEIIEKWAAENASGMKPIDIAAKWGVTKNTIIGALDRRGLRLDGKASAKTPRRIRERQKDGLPPAKPRNASGKKPQKATSRQKEAVRAAKRKRPVGRPDMDYPEREGVPLEALEKDQCRFIVTYDRPFRYCGKHTKGTYCKEHAERAYVQD